MSSTVRRRPVGVYGKEKEEGESSSEGKAEGVARRHQSAGWRDLIILLSFFLLVIMVTTGYLVHRLGFAYLVPQSFKRLGLSPAQAEREVESHTFLFVGGPHRGGTTILWKCLREHPLISGFADRVGTDYSEGMFLQSVYPTFGIGQEIVHQVGKSKRQSRSPLGAGGQNARGLGAYAFNPTHHLTEEQVTVRSRTMLMNEWGYLWDLSKPVLLEKSPPNMIISTFLQEVFSTGELPNTSDVYTTSAKFLFISRHPIANALALGKFLAGGIAEDGLPDVFEQVLHWLVSHETMNEDMERLEDAHIIRFEDFVMDPQGHVDDILEWLGIATPATEQFKFETEVARDTNAKYETQYCQSMRRFPHVAARHRRMSSKLGDRVKAQGYDLDSFSCVQEILERYAEKEEPAQKDVSRRQGSS